MKMGKSAFYVTLGLMLLVGYDFFGKSKPKYEVNECAVDFLHNETRQIEGVQSYIYRYCKYVDGKCSAKYSMRIKDFDRITKKTKCKEKK